MRNGLAGPVAGAAFVALAMAPIVARAQAGATLRPPPEVKTAATAERSVAPDLARITFTFQRDGKTRTEAGDRLAAHMDSVRKALVALGIPRDSLFTASSWYWWSGRLQVVPGEWRMVPGPNDPPYRPTVRVQDTLFRMTDNIEAHISDLSKVGAVIDAALALRVTTISSIRFSARNTSEAQASALREATQRAREQAQAIAEAGGARLGAVLGFSTERDPGGYGFYGSPLDQIVVTSASFQGDESSRPGTEISRPMIPVRVTVYGRWALLVKP